MLKLKISHKGKVYKYLITFGYGNRIYGNGSDRIMVDKQGRRMEYDESGNMPRWL